MATPPREICFVALARRTDNVVLAHRVHMKKNEYDFLAKVNLILSSPGWKGITNDKISLEDDGFNIYISIDERDRVYIAIATRAYPTRYIYSSSDGTTRGILGVMRQAVLERYEDIFLTCGPGGLQSKASDILKSVCTEFNDLQSIDKIAHVQAKVDSVTGIMRNNIQMALKNTDRIEEIDDKAVHLRHSAEKFKNAGNQLKREMRCRYWKMMLLIGLVVAIILAIIIGYIVSSTKKKEE